MASVKINGKVVEWSVKTASATQLSAGSGITFDDAIQKAGFKAGEFTIDYTVNNKVTITAAAEGKNVIKGFKVTGEAAPDTAKFTKDAVKNGRGVNKSDILKLQVGDTNDEFNKISVDVKEMSADGLGIYELKISSQEEAGAAISKIRSAIESVSKTRSDMGALQNRLDHVINNLGVATENMTDSESRIRDVDMAHEMMVYTKNNILTQAAQAMLAQANMLPQGVLQLLR